MLGGCMLATKKTHTSVVALLEVVDPAGRDVAGSEGGLCCGRQQKPLPADRLMRHHAPAAAR